MRSSKACPVVVRHGASGDELLVFRHPRAGVQLVKGTIEPDEAPEHAALRELAEESGIVDAETGETIGEWDSEDQGQIWVFVEIRLPGVSPERWTHFTHDGGGHEFAFFWHPLSAAPTDEWHPVFARALAFVRAWRAAR
jgi:8-oxo-dGTP pyrophosphatase MutT (NUDIX family)